MPKTDIKGENFFNNEKASTLTENKHTGLTMQAQPQKQ